MSYLLDTDHIIILQRAGFRLGDAEDFLGLSEDEAQIVEFRVNVGRWIRRLRESRGITQQELARSLKTTQPRVARIEASDPGVSLDQMFRGFFLAGGRLSDLVGGSAARTANRKLVRPRVRGADGSGRKSSAKTD